MSNSGKPTFSLKNDALGRVFTELEEACEAAQSIVDALKDGGGCSVAINACQGGKTALECTITSRRMRATIFERLPASNSVTERNHLDVTTAVLRLTLKDLHALASEHSSECAEVLMNIGASILDGHTDAEWCSLMDGILSFFGVAHVRDITARAFEFAQVTYGYKEEPTRRVRVTLTVDLEVEVPEGQDIGEVMDEMNYDFKSTTEGARIRETNIRDWSTV